MEKGLCFSTCSLQASAEMFRERRPLQQGCKFGSNIGRAILNMDVVSQTFSVKIIL